MILLEHLYYVNTLITKSFLRCLILNIKYTFKVYPLGTLCSSRHIICKQYIKIIYYAYEYYIILPLGLIAQNGRSIKSVHIKHWNKSLNHWIYWKHNFLIHCKIAEIYFIQNKFILEFKSFFIFFCIWWSFWKSNYIKNYTYFKN